LTTITISEGKLTKDK